MITIDNRNIFFEKLKTGVNLFIGAGFSVLESPTGSRLPIANELCKEICETFKIDKKYSKDLEKLSSILKRNCKEQFQKYLREKYKVNDFNSLYCILDKFNISSIITTNIDNLIYAIIDKSNRYYLNNISYYGAVKKDGSAIEYIPLHGEILNIESELYFGKFELCNVDHQNKGLFSMMESALLRKPTIFWGYGFRDGSVSAVIDRVLEKGKQDIWIQLMPDSDDIEFFKDLGCNVIIGDTESLLKEIVIELSNTEAEKTSHKPSDFWKKYSIPSINQVESLPIKDFYEQGRTHWYYVLTDKAYLTQNVNAIIETSLTNKNVIVVGIPLGGKTTTLMQVACKIKKPTFFVENLNEEEAKLICKNAIRNNDEYLLLIDNCSEDMNAYRVLAECKNIKTIATSDDFMYESSKHILEKVPFKKIDMLDIDRNEAQRIFSSIPTDLRNKKFKYKSKDEDKYSILELLSLNVKNVLSQDKIEGSLTKVQTQNKEAFELILLTAYLVYNKSALTTDVLIRYFGTTDVKLIKQKIDIAQSYLSEINVTIDQEIYNQDYFSLRSTLFTKYAHIIAVSKVKNDYGKVIKKFVQEMDPCLIFKNHVFRRSAYDANLFFDIFDENGDEIYDEVYKNTPNAYTLQQWALYKAKTKRFSEAFSDIDIALHMQPNNFSIKNARAIILFEANKDKKTMAAKKSLEESMNILSECYQSDKRKVYHAQKYAEFALSYLNIYDDNRYIEQAFVWLTELIKNEDSMSRKTKNLYGKLKKIK